MRYIIDLFIFFFALEIGSFANVCIYRWPRKGNVVFPQRSYCPWCRHQIAWYNNIPVLSYLFLRGRCQSCASPISVRYPLVELLMPLLWMGAWYEIRKTSTPSPLFLVLIFSLLFCLVVTTFTDLEWKIIPDQSTIFLTLVGLGLSPWNVFLGTTPAEGIQQSLLGFVVAGSLLFVVSSCGQFIFAKEALGGGDIKLLAAIGTVLGWQGALLSFFIAALTGSIASIVGILTKSVDRRQYIPFGPFIDIGAGVVLFLKISDRMPPLF